MKLRLLISIVIAGALSSAGALAGGRAQHTPKTPPPAATTPPPLTALPDDAVATGATVGSGSGTVGFDSTSESKQNVDYWRIGEEPSAPASPVSGAHSGAIVHPEPNR